MVALKFYGGEQSGIYSGVIDQLQALSLGIVSKPRDLKPVKKSLLRESFQRGVHIVTRFKRSVRVRPIPLLRS